MMYKMTHSRTSFDKTLEIATYEIYFEAPNCEDDNISECFNLNYLDEL